MPREGNSAGFADGMSGTLVVRVDMSKCHKRKGAAFKLLKNSLSVPTAAGVDQYVADEVAIGEGAGEFAQAPDPVSELLHGNIPCRPEDSSSDFAPKGPNGQPQHADSV